MNNDLDRQKAIVQHYEAMSAVSARMHVAAKNNDWDEVIRAERECVRIIADLEQLGDLTPTDQTLRERKNRLIREVLANDAEVRSLAEPRLRHLEMLMRGPRNVHKLESTYGAGSRQSDAGIGLKS